MTTLIKAGNFSKLHKTSRSKARRAAIQEIKQVKEHYAQCFLMLNNAKDALAEADGRLDHAFKKCKEFAPINKKSI